MTPGEPPGPDPTPDPAAPDPVPPDGATPSAGARRPGAETWARALGAVVAAAAVTTFTCYFAVPVGDGADGTTFAALDSTYRNVGFACWSLLIAALGLAAAIRPSLGVECVALGAVASPWIVRTAGLLLDTDDRTTVATVLAVAALVLLLALGTAVVVALVLGRRAGGGYTVPDAAALVVAGAALWATLGVGWYRAVDLGTDTVFPSRFGSLLETDRWAGRTTWAALLLAFGALCAAVAAGDWPRRAAGGVVIAVLGLEAARRSVLPAADLFPPRTATGLAIDLGGRTVVALVAVQAVGAVAGAWLLTGDQGRTAVPGRGA